MKVKGIGDVTFKQCAGFLRISGAKNPLDSTAIHPESYQVVQTIADIIGFSLKHILSKDRHREIALKIEQYFRNDLELQKLADKLDVGVPTLRDIIQALRQPGRDPREDVNMTTFLKKDITTFDNLSKHYIRQQYVTLSLEEGMVLKGTVRNIVDFGAFVDIGVKESALLHVSNMKMPDGKRVIDPFEVVTVGSVINVKIVRLEPERKRIGVALLHDNVEKTEETEFKQSKRVKKKTKLDKSKS